MQLHCNRWHCSRPCLRVEFQVLHSSGLLHDYKRFPTLGQLQLQIQIQPQILIQIQIQEYSRPKAKRRNLQRKSGIQFISCPSIGGGASKAKIYLLDTFPVAAMAAGSCCRVRGILIIAVPPNFDLAAYGIEVVHQRYPLAVLSVASVHFLALFSLKKMTSYQVLRKFFQDLGLLYCIVLFFTFLSKNMKSF